MDSESSTDQEAANVGKRSKHEKAKKGAAQAILFLSIRPSGDESVVSANRLEQQIGGSPSGREPLLSEELYIPFWDMQEE